MSLILQRFRKLPVMGILRGINEEQLHSLSEVIVSSGLKTVEITMNTPHAPVLINKLIQVAGKDLIVGAGTVLNRNDLMSALESGAQFIVSPSVDEDVIEYCHFHSVPVFPGALTPTEIHKAWQAGATMVKVFPASLFGPEYFKEIKGPFSNIELMAVGGVSHDTIASYFQMGASAVAFGSGIFKREYLQNAEFKLIEKEISQLIGSYTKWLNRSHNNS